MKALDLFKTLRRSASSDVPDSTIYNLISYVFGVSKIDVALDKDIIIDQGELRRVVYLLGENVPFAYITATRPSTEETFTYCQAFSSHVMRQSFWWNLH